VVESKTPQEYEENWVAFISAYAEQQDLLTYLEQYQLTFKEHFIKAWINAYRYYGVTTTSALEGLHSIVKRWLVTSTNDLLGVVNTLKVMLDEQHSRVRNGLATAQARPPFAVQPKYLPILPAKINECITPYALAKVREQYELAKQPNFAERRREHPCTRSFKKIYGLPCCHEIANALRVASNWTLSRHDIDAHWYFERPQHLGPQPAIRLPSPPGVRIPLIREPLVVRSSGRPRADDRDRTTRRNPSHWEQPIGPTPPSQPQASLAQPPLPDTPINAPAPVQAQVIQPPAPPAPIRGRPRGRPRGSGRGGGTRGGGALAVAAGGGGRARRRGPGRPSLAVRTFYPIDQDIKLIIVLV
jgi:hypothetical protein